VTTRTAASSFVPRGDSECDLPLETRGRPVKFVLLEHLSHGDNFMMFWEMIFRVILAYLRKLASQRRGRSAGATASVVQPAVMGLGAIKPSLTEPRGGFQPTYFESRFLRARCGREDHGRSTDRR
jgi:hypothetical protein